MCGLPIRQIRLLHRGQLSQDVRASKQLFHALWPAHFNFLLNVDQAILHVMRQINRQIQANHPRGSLDGMRRAHQTFNGVHIRRVLLQTKQTIVQ